MMFSPAGKQRRSRTTALSGDDVLDDLAGDIGQAEVTALKAIRQFLVVEAEQVQDRRLQVVDVDRLVDGVETQLVRSSVGKASLCAAAGEEDGEGVRVMIAAQVLAGRGAALAERRASELAGPDDQRR